MNKEQLEKLFDKTFPVGVGTKEDVKAFVFSTVIKEVLKSVLPEERHYCDWADDYNLCIDNIKQKAKEQFNIDL